MYDGEHSPEAAKGAADRLHLILQREDALVAKSSGERPTEPHRVCRLGHAQSFNKCLFHVIVVAAIHEKRHIQVSRGACVKLVV